MEHIAYFLFYLGCVFVLICVHETGHYLAGRLGGISAGDMRIRLLTFPQHVVLRSGEDWVAPTSQIERYVELVWEFLKTKPKVYLFVAGGFLWETLFTVTLGTVLILSGYSKMAWAIAGLSLMIALPWLILDPIMICRGRIFGDLSGLWFLNRPATLGFIFVLIASRGFLLWWAS
jgi:hypothetical protein